MGTKGFVLRKLAQVREHAGFDQQELADEAGVTLAMVQRAERGHGCFRKTVERYAYALGRDDINAFLKEVS